MQRLVRSASRLSAVPRSGVHRLGGQVRTKVVVRSTGPKLDLEEMMEEFDVETGAAKIQQRILNRQRHMKRAVKRKENARAGRFYTAVREVNDVMRKILVRGSRRGGF